MNGPNASHYDVLELAGSNVELRANMINARVCSLCSFGFSGNAKHTLYGVDEKNRYEYEADFECIGNLSDNIRLRRACYSHNIEKIRI